MTLPKAYMNEIRKITGYWGTYLPSDRLSPGMVGRVENGFDLLDRHLQVPEPADDLCRRYLVGVVVAVPGIRVHLHRFEQPDLVVVTQRLHAEVRHQ